MTTPELNDLLAETWQAAVAATGELVRVLLGCVARAVAHDLRVP